MYPDASLRAPSGTARLRECLLRITSANRRTYPIVDTSTIVTLVQMPIDTSQGGASTTIKISVAAKTPTAHLPAILDGSTSPVFRADDETSGEDQHIAYEQKRDKPERQPFR